MKSLYYVDLDYMWLYNKGIVHKGLFIFFFCWTNFIFVWICLSKFVFVLIDATRLYAHIYIVKVMNVLKNIYILKQLET
jgi:hypothetical protein